MRPAVIQGEVRGASVLFGKRRSLLVKVQDHTGLVNLRFYHFNAAQRISSAPAPWCAATANRAGASGLELYHPEYSIIDEGLDADLEPSLTPVYPATDGISQQRLRLLHEQALTLLAADQVELTDLLPPQWLQQWRLPTLKDAAVSA